MSEKQIPKTRLCKCGSPASVIKDYWVSESGLKENDGLSERTEYVCGIIRRRFCPECLSRLATHQIKVNRRLNAVIFGSVLLPLVLAIAKFSYDFFALSDRKSLLPLIITSIFTVAIEGIIAFKFGASQRKRKKIRSGDISDSLSVDKLLDSLNFGLDEPEKIKNVFSSDVISDGEGRINYGMERSGFNMRIMLNGRISIEPVTERIKYPFDSESEYVKRVYINAGLLEDNTGFETER